MEKEIFISYSRKDFDKVKAIKDEIDRELGIKCWMDLDGIESGEQFKKVIIKAINEHETFLFMLSSNSMVSQYALKELGFAAEKRKRVILVFIEPCQMTDDFLFEYKDCDNIDWNNALQHHKLMTNLRRWYKGTRAKEKTIQELAEEGEPESQYKLGKMYYSGEGVPKDYAKAVKWYRKAAEQGYMEAQYELGTCYRFGYGVQHDYSQEIYWYRRAAEQGHIHAQIELGGEYAVGIGIKQDDVQAIYWLTKAAEQGSAHAQVILGNFYEAGICVKQDYTQAAYWYKKAAKQGDEEAIEWLKARNIDY